MARTADPNRRADILAAARATFLERGFIQTRIADIAARAGIAPGTVYLYFASKEAIVLALADEFYAHLGHAVLPVIAESAPERVVADAVRATLALSAEASDLLKLKILDAGLNRFANTPARQAFQQALAERLADLMDRAVIYRYDPPILAELIIGIVERAGEVCLLHHAGDLRAYEATLIALLERALLRAA